VTASPPEAAPHPASEYADQVVAVTGGESSIHFGTIKVAVEPSNWVAALTAARDELGLVFFSFLSAIDWSNEVAVGDPLEAQVEERLELLATVGDVSEGRRVTFSTSLSKDDARIDTITGVYAGADWHEREAAEMFGIDFHGHPNLTHLYLPDGFLGNPLRKSFRLGSREVKPWPGKVDVEGMPTDEADEANGTEPVDPGAPSTENPEA
jgi:NADH-quinone oxidoreductase subunit C